MINYEKFKVVKNMNTLKAMQKMGLIEFCEQTGEKIHGLYDSHMFTCYYINEAPFTFEYKNKTFGQKYFSGCFMPYVVEYETIN